MVIITRKKDLPFSLKSRSIKFSEHIHLIIEFFSTEEHLSPDEQCMLPSANCVLCSPCYLGQRSQEWARAVKAPVDERPFPEAPPSLEGYLPSSRPPPDRFFLSLRPNVGGDEHLPALLEGPWSPDGEVWFEAKISFVRQGLRPGVQGDSPSDQNPSDESSSGPKAVVGRWKRPPGLASSALFDAIEAASELDSLSVTLRPEGVTQLTGRLESERRTEMAKEDETSRELAKVSRRLADEARARKIKAKDALATSKVAAQLETRSFNNAFSILVIRANFRAPVERASHKSGSWAQMMRELIGSPVGTRLRRVSGMTLTLPPPFFNATMKNDGKRHCF